MKIKLDINFYEAEYKQALERNIARLDILKAENLADLFDEFDNCLTSEEQSQNSSNREGDRLRNKAEKAKQLLGDDNSEMWEKDHVSIINLHPKVCGTYHTYLTIQNIPALGRTPKEMWKNYLSILDAGVKKTEEVKRCRIKEKETQRKEMENKYGKPVRLHPEFGNSTNKYFTPEFANGGMSWGLSYLFPYKDFPEHDGKSIIELENLD